MCIVCASCNSGESSNNIKFETLEGTIQKPVTFHESPYDSISIEYKIAWPVDGNKNMVSYLQSWIIDRISAGSGIKNAKLGVIDILDSIANEMSRDDESMMFDKKIEVSIEENTPFDSYLTLNVMNEGYIWLARYQDLNNASLTIRLTDGEIFQADKAIRSEESMRNLIVKHIEKNYKKEDPNWQWSNEIIFYNKYNLPLPKNNITLTKDGVFVAYDMGEITASPAGMIFCTIPYDEAIPVLSKNAQDFLNYGNHSNNINTDTNNSSDKNKTSSELSNQDIIKLIKQANIKGNTALSEDLKKVTDKDTGKSTIINYSEFAYVPDITIEVSNIDMSDSGDYATVAFYFAPLYEGEYDKSNLSDDEYLRLAKFVFENGTWKVDDIGWDVVTSSGNYNAQQWYKEYERKYSM